VPKPALGRKFVNLMKGLQAASSSAEHAASSARLSPGMAKLLRGDNGAPGHSQRPGSTTEAASPVGHGPDVPTASSALLHRRRKRLLRASLLLADLVLFVMAARGMRHRPVGVGGIALCVLAVALGAWLTCLALWPEDQT
jgi:hypothetical protein